jgi:hypothetical protein
VTGRETIPLAGLAFALFVFGVVLLTALYRGQSDLFAILLRGFGAAVIALIAGSVLGYIGLVVYEGVGEAVKVDKGEKPDKGKKPANVKEGGAV